ncbi:hypothetical protein K466DRAFT_353361 [Polyporus arcularius HHB13444]|uniref:Pentacotripeptide-repeat region of PRORP domain-containing protein n=1 Tax=Polyporus arcularius HHB13444 TaxID=1314778 RepID=A0A5C3Q2E9_9APHY|nr:hypothetical protein K466DRAFT_353361 [Polyporus arcularius HHB13444]
MFGWRAFAGGRHITSRLPLSPLCRRALTNAAPSYVPCFRQHAPEQPPLDESPSQKFYREVNALYSFIQGTGPPRIALSRFRKNTAALPRGLLVEESSRTLLRQVVAALSRSTHSQDSKALRNFLRTVAELEAVDVAAYVATTLDQLYDSEDATTAEKFMSVASKMPELQGMDALSSLWDRLLDHAAGQRNEYIIPIILKDMQNSGVRLEGRTAKVIISALFRGPSHPSTPWKPPSFATMKHIINLLAPAKLPYDPDVADIIVGGYTRSGQKDLATLVESLYISSVSHIHNAVAAERLHEMISGQVAAGHRTAAVRLARRCLELGLPPSDEMLLAAMGTNLSAATLREWRNILGYRGSSEVSAKVLSHLIESGDQDKVVSFYSQEFRDGIPSDEMLYLILKFFLSSGIRKPSDLAIDQALRFYRDYVSRYRDSSAGTETAQTVPSLDDSAASGHLKPPGSRIYQLLLRVLTSSAHPALHLHVAVSLVEDMHEFGIRIDPQSTASVLVLLMRSSPTPVEAMKIYRFMGSPAHKGDPPVLNEEGYAAVLDTFCHLENWPNGIPSVRQYFQIVSDMRQYGVPVTSKIFTVIIRQLADLATAASAAAATDAARDGGDHVAALEVRESIARTLKHVHNQLTVNTEFTPDTPLWNQLMDAYQRAGCFTEALRIWHKLFALGQFTHASISIIIDACAFHRAYDVAVRIFTALTEIGYGMNLRNWNTFLECLCRLDRLDEAMKVLCLEMNGRDDGIAPDEDSVRILIKFAAMKNQETEVRSKVKRFLPKLYWSLPEDLR